MGKSGCPRPLGSQPVHPPAPPQPTYSVLSLFSRGFFPGLLAGAPGLALDHPRPPSPTNLDALRHGLFRFRHPQLEDAILTVGFDSLRIYSRWKGDTAQKRAGAALADMVSLILLLLLFSDFPADR